MATVWPDETPMIYAVTDFNSETKQFIFENAINLNVNYTYQL